ncbi:similar to Saccharomyces cerevisiae YMR257C PET111 Mitochondrial translational activator specific for the COX2 mRNA [Maudiozyma saulgeensis]|uniref:Similar to Saccharomyces cerevisiae YMR257C PET111 Mitochondrial translational activator specific for the COX2 mRNA n=1 Tax=Maudiozyma saulgeensis TaxID=1789683 RepID=A0A1X7R8W8_9SACH|nr:similar to Saccharomyces cerevisiae YMR257C PET111 Mitochondrial translational activator specific for the COX2 mRNA [Kazachstania saulgeensis]
MIRRRLLVCRRILNQQTRIAVLLNIKPLNNTCLYHTTPMNRENTKVEDLNAINYNDSITNNISPTLNSNSNLNKIKMDEKNEELAKWIRNSYIETPLTISADINVPLTSYDDGYNLDSSGGGFIGGIPAVDEDTFNIIWKYKFCIGDPQTVEVVIKRISNRRTIFNVKQLTLLLSSLKELKRYTQIHRIYAGYSVYLKYFLEDNVNGITDEDKDLFLELFMECEKELSNYTNCEKLFSHYIKYSRIKSEVTLLGLRSFIENNNLQVAKEFFIQIMTNKETFPLSSKDFYKLLKFLNTVRNYKTMDYFYQLWLHYRNEEINLTEDNINITSLMYRTYLLSDNEEKVNTFLNNENIKNSKFKTTIRYELTKFYYKIFSLAKVNNNALLMVDIPTELKEEIKLYSEKLKDNFKERRLFYLTLLQAYTKLNNITEIKKLLEIVDEDPNIELDSDFHAGIITYFIKNGKLIDLIDYYKELKKMHTKISDKKMFISLYRCFQNANSIISQEYRNEMLLILKSTPVYEHAFPWITKHKLFWRDKHNLSYLDSITYSKFRSALKVDDLIEAKMLLISRCRDGIMPNVNMFYILLNMCLEGGYINLATMIDQMIKDMYHPNSHMTMKIQLLWLKKHLLLSKRTQVAKREEIIRIEARFKNSIPSFQNLIQLADIYSGIYDFENCQRILKSAFSKMNQDDRREWLMYYCTLLKAHCKALDWEQFILVLKDWNSNKKAYYLNVNTVKQLKQFMKFMTKRQQEEDNVENESLGEISLIDRYEKEILAELLKLGQTYGVNKINTLNDMDTVSKFLQGVLKRRLNEITKEYLAKRQELISRYKHLD